MIKKHYILIVLFFSLSLSVLSQEENDIIQNKYDNALELFNNEDFDNALTLFLELDSLRPDNFEIKYYTGACFLNSKFERVKAIPYILYAIDKKKSLLPEAIYCDLASLCHLDNQFNKAIENFSYYLKLSDKNDKKHEYALRMIEVCNNAKIITKDTLNIKIDNIGAPINTEYSEFRPLISTDETIIYFTRDSQKDNNYSHPVEEIYFSEKLRKRWSEPRKINLNANNNDLSISGISPDGEQLFVTIKDGNDNGDIYAIFLSDDRSKTSNLIKLDKNINSPFNETRVSMTADGRDFYFASDRPGGYGGKDIYKVLKAENGLWGEPINLGSEINTKYDEDAPFIHPDKQTLYFSSQGHNSIGGYDIFESFYDFFNKKWALPKNIGYPINSTKDDMYFILSANGTKGYFSSSHKKQYDSHNIYIAQLKNSIPLTLVKGTILAGNPLKPIAAKISVINKETNSLLKYIYNPNPKTGRYLMIFPPGKNYDMIVKADGYHPQQINIHIPNQTYFYEMFQEIQLQPITSLGKVVGEEITVTNSFFDIYQTSASNPLIQNQIDTIPAKKYSELLDLIESLIETTDSLGLEEIESKIDTINNVAVVKEEKNYIELLNLIEKAIETTDSTALTLLDINTVYNEKSSRIFFYGISEDDTDLITYMVGKDTIYTVPPLNLIKNKAEESYTIDGLLNDTNYVTIESGKEILNKIISGRVDIRNSEPCERKTIINYSVHFETNEFKIRRKHNKSLNQLIELLTNNPNLGAEIIGFSSSEGEEKANEILSKQRTRSTLEYFINNGVSSKKIILYGFGEKYSTNEKSEADRKQNRRADIRVFEVVKCNDANTLKDSINYNFKVEKPIIIDIPNKDTVSPENVNYKIQILISEEKLRSKDLQFKGLDVEYYYNDIIYRYTTGRFDNYEDAKKEVLKVQKLGFIGATIIAFDGAKKIPVNK